MILVLPFHTGDVFQAIDLLDWIKLLGKCPKHDCLLVADAAVQWSDCSRALDLARDCFKSAELICTDKPLLGWPQASNAMFLLAASHVYSTRGQPFFWMEPDCIPLKAGWLDAIEDGHKKCGKPFMGAFVHSQNPTLPKVSLAGCAVYPPDTFQRLQGVFPCKRAWDVDTASVVIPQAANTLLIQHFFGQIDLAPTFALHKTPYSPINTFTLENLHPNAVVFHRNKDGTLLRILHQKMFPETQEFKGERPCFVQLGRFGDIILLLPAMLEWSRRIGQPPIVVTSEAHASVFEGVSYVEVEALKVHWWNDLYNALHHAQKKYGSQNVFMTQLHGGGKFSRISQPSYSLEMWLRTGLLDCFYTAPLVFDRRSSEREAQLARQLIHNGKPAVLINMAGITSPLPNAWKVIQLLTEKLSSRFDIVDISAVRAHRIFDLLGLMDRAAGMVTIDTATLHLAHGSSIPYVGLTQDTVNKDGSGKSVPRGNCVLEVPYSQAVGDVFNSADRMARAIMDHALS